MFPLSGGSRRACVVKFKTDPTHAGLVLFFEDAVVGTDAMNALYAAEVAYRLMAGSGGHRYFVPVRRSQDLPAKWATVEGVLESMALPVHMQPRRSAVLRDSNARLRRRR